MKICWQFVRCLPAFSIFAMLPRYFTYHHIVAAFLLFAFLAQHFSANLIVVDYVVRTEAYARYCVNKAKPQLHCKGKCQMMRKMAEQEKKSPALPEAPSVKLNIWCHVLHDEYTCLPPMESKVSLSWLQQRKDFIPSPSGSAIFHPPRLVA